MEGLASGFMVRLSKLDDSKVEVSDFRLRLLMVCSSLWILSDASNLEELQAIVVVSF